MNDRDLAKIVWDYMLMHAPIKESDVIIVLSSIDPRVAEYGAELWKNKYAPTMLFSGTGLGHHDDLLATNFGTTESEYFAGIARKAGVPESAILIENESRNTGENARISFEKLRAEGTDVQTVIVVTKPYMERRAYATFKKQWPDENIEIVVTSPPISFDEYCTGEQPFEKVVNLMIGDLQRIAEYPALGFQIEQTIPQSVRDAAEELAQRGYAKHALKN